MVNLVQPDQEDNQVHKDFKVQVDLQGSVVNPDLKELKDQEENQAKMEHLVCNVY